MNVHLRNLPDDTHAALPVIAAAYNLGSSNELILAAVDAMVTSIRESDPVIDAAVKLSIERRKAMA